MPQRSATAALSYTILALLFFVSASFAQSSQHYALLLEDPPVASRFASREALGSTAAESYRGQIRTAQAAVRRQMAARNLTVAGSVDTLLNAVFVVAPPDRVAELRSVPGVKAVVAMRYAQPFLNRATQLLNAPAAWTASGGQSNAGKGVKVGILDYGIDQTHPAFQDSSLAMPAGFPKCTDGHPEDCAFTNNKVIVARSYTRLIAPGSDPASSRPDDFSPRDREGHGTAVASCVAANSATGAVSITGMAPKAYLGNYKIFGSPFVNDVTPESVIILAAEDALKDGMDVINLSAGLSSYTGALDTGAACGLPANTPCDPLAAAFENAVKAGLTIVVAAGNSGFDGINYPTLNSIASPAHAPDVIAVGAITNTHFFDESVNVAGAPSGLQNIAASQGDDTFAPIGAAVAPLKDVTTLGNDGYACAALPGGALNGAFALIQRSQVGSATACTFADKVTNATDAGAVGVVFYMSDASALISPGGLDGFGVPVAMISLSDGQALQSYINAHPGSLVTIDPSGLEHDDTADGNLFAFFSSMGPSTGDSLVKPDLVAVGSSAGSLAVNGVYMAAQNYDPLGGQYSTTRFAGANGTSFASPLVAGAAALVKQKHPTWTPAQIKSALVNTADQSVTQDDGGKLVDVQWLGAGKLDAGAAVNATVLASPVTLSFGVLAAAPSGVTKQIALTNTGSSSVSLTAAVAAGPKSLTGNLTDGLVPTLDKTSLSLAPGASGSVTVTLSGALPQPGSYSGAVTLKASGVSLVVPYLYLVGGGLATADNFFVLGSTGFEGIVGQSPFNPLNPTRPGSIAVKLVDGAGVPVVGAPVTWAVTPRGSVTFQNADTATNSFGIATADLLLAQEGRPTVTVTSGRLQSTFNGFVRAQPTISPGGVVDAASFKTPVAPGSYISIFGTNLNDPGFTGTATTAILPLTIQGVTVSFDVPSAKLSAPGYLSYQSPGQVNVFVPWELQGQTSAQVKVTVDNFSHGNVVTVPLSDFAPGFFENSGLADALTLDFTLISTSNPAKRGSIVQLFANGLGPVNNQPKSGEPAPGPPNLATTKNPVVVTIGGQKADVGFSGLAPGFAGLYQINVTVPPNLSPGSQPITILAGGQTSKTSSLPVQ